MSCERPTRYRLRSHGTTDKFPVRLTEELILLMLNEQSGYLEMVPGWDFSCVMAGAVIADLALESRIDTDFGVASSP